MTLRPRECASPTTARILTAGLCLLVTATAATVGVDRAYAAAPTFGTPSTYATGDGPFSVASADFNGANGLDLAVANGGLSDDDASVLLNDGAGAFGAKTDYPTGNRPFALASADFDGANGPDLAVANSVDDDVTILLNNGAVGFTSADFPTGDNPFSVATGDFNGDGKPDLAIANRNAGTVSVLLNNGSGGFGAKVDYTVGANPRGVTIGEFDSVDGPDIANLDLATANSNTNNVSVLDGDGTGAFGTKTDFATGGSQPSAVTSADFNGDSKPDLATAGVEQPVGPPQHHCRRRQHPTGDRDRLRAVRADQWHESVVHLLQRVGLYVRVPSGRARLRHGDLRGLRIAQVLLGPRERRLHVPSARDRRGGQHRRVSGRAQLHRRSEA